MHYGYYDTFKIVIDNDGKAVIEEDFTESVADFKHWCLSQEKALQDIFIKKK